MTSTFNNVALFIKRTEEYQTKDFIIQQFDTNNIGKVRDIKFIKKTNDMRASYNGAIVIFDRWNMNKMVQSLFSEMSTSHDGTTRFYFDNCRYWIIQVYKQNLPECEEITVVDSSLTDKEKIRQLEALVKSMSAQIFYLQNNQEKTERQMMENEHKETRHHLVNIELTSQLEETLRDKIWAEEEQLVLKEENEALRYRLALNAVDLVRKEEEFEFLRQEKRDQECILDYINNQAQEMKQLLRGTTTEENKTRIKEYLY